VRGNCRAALTGYCAGRRRDTRSGSRVDLALETRAEAPPGHQIDARAQGAL